MIDIGIIAGSGIYALPGAVKLRRVETCFGEVKLSVTEVGPWKVGFISRHGEGHRHLPHTVPHRAHLAALKQLGARAVLATTAVGAVDPRVRLGSPVIFDDLFFPENRLPGGEPCTMFSDPGDAERGHLIANEPFAPRLRLKAELAARDLGLEPTPGGVYGHTNGPRFETASEIRMLRAAGVGAVSQTSGPEAVLAGELELPYALVGFPVNYATGTPGIPQETREDLDGLLALSAEMLPRIVLQTVETLEREDLTFDHGLRLPRRGRRGTDMMPRTSSYNDREYVGGREPRCRRYWW